MKCSIIILVLVHWAFLSDPIEAASEDAAKVKYIPQLLTVNTEPVPHAYTNRLESNTVLTQTEKVDPEPKPTSNITTTSSPVTTTKPPITTPITTTPKTPTTSTASPSTTTTAPNITTPTPPITTTPTPSTTTLSPNTTTSIPPNSTTVVPPTTTTTIAPPITTTVAPKPTSKPEPDRKFDGPSFVGGIVFTIGLMVIGFISWKFYQARTGPNYHIL